ncbi:MAG: phosphoribosylpyrophosphate synthetase [Flavobacteriales bacterium]|nr:phosphoribosylpyrophosphate synthetase [Flavobacteriales bacterium]
MQAVYDTLSEAIDALHANGFTAQFQAESEGVRCLDTDKLYLPDLLKITEIHRFEGETDPADSSELLVIECHDGVKGTLTMSYGAKNDQDDDMIRKIPVFRNSMPANH